ncbi:ABC transporter permease subunit [Ignisphaera sp. 4213-co]|uniref:ABC transporter permease subunit n=1 Tax=Ignisphaera cupida TaxID=3050454 RepID=A0ABD4Z879_9CREN|nr:ABC transporter permease subunit [Ignisphaera sp. 4213-co]MDK6029217.1 ABC transporter permease subunit [Ignisphaera sp. 4213-co]
MLLLLACLASFGRMVSAYIISLFVAISIGISMARRKAVESILLPVLDILQSIPILGFFPIAIVVFATVLPRSIGLELAAVFLIVTSLLWNMIFGVYTAIKSLDPSLFTMASVYKMGLFSRLAYIYVPAARAAIAANSIISWAGGWFFLTSAEVIATGSEEYKLFGIGSLIMDFYSSGKTVEFYITLSALFIIIIISYILIFNPATNFASQQYLLPAYSKPFYYIYKLVSSIWSFLTWLGIKLESRKIGVHSAIVLVFTLTAMLMHLNMFVSIQIDYFPILNFVYNFLLSLARVSLIVLLSFVLTIGIAYLALVRRWGPAIAIAGEFLASIPAIIWWPLLSPLISTLPWVVSFIVFLQGSLWYEFFSVILFGVPKIRSEILDLAKIYGVKGFNYFRYILIPSLMPSIASGALSAWGGAWNATIVAEYFASATGVVDLGGVGSMLSKYADEGRFDLVLYTVLLWSLAIAVLNKVVWSRILKQVEKSFLVE